MKRWPLLALLALSACKGQIVEQGVLVTVDNKSSATGIVGLHAVVSNLDRSQTLLLPDVAQSTPIDFPTQFSISVPSTRGGRVDIAVDGLDSVGVAVANGAGFAVLQGSAFVGAFVDLLPVAIPPGTGGAAGPEADASQDLAAQPGIDVNAMPDIAVATADGAGAGAGGVDGAGGAVGSGGITGNGGAPTALGGTVGAGGVVGAGGLVGTGGLVGAGGIVEAGGAVVRGGTLGPGGVVGAGGLVGTGGLVGAGGIAGTGGLGGGGSVAGGSGGGGDTRCPADPGSSAANFCNGKAQGAMTGNGWISLGLLDTVADPVCADNPADLTNTRPITGPPVGQCEAEGKTCPRTGLTIWNAPDRLCVSGTIPKVTTPSGSTSPDYKSAWGILIGVNTGDPPATDGGKSLGDVVSDASSFQTIALTTEGSVTPTNIRVSIHLKDMPCVADPYCANMSASDRTIALGSFNTECWNGSSCGSSTTCKQLKPSDIPNIDQIGVQISADTRLAYTVDNYCLKAITFGK